MSTLKSRESSTTYGITAPTWTIDLVELRSIRDDFNATLHMGRERWYSKQLQNINWKKENEKIEQFVQSSLSAIHTDLAKAASRGESQIVFHILHPFEALGWKFANYSPEGTLLFHRVFDISMNVALHQTRIRSANIIKDAISASSANCTLTRGPSDAADCFVEQLSLTIKL